MGNRRHFLGNKDGEAVISIGDKDYNANEFLSEYEKREELCVYHQNMRS